MNRTITNWWTQQANKNKAARAKYKSPDKCVFCSRKIEDGDFFNVGYDRYKIYAETCDRIHCKQWLKWKMRRKK